MKARTIVVSLSTFCLLLAVAGWSAGPASAAPSAPVKPMPMGPGCGNNHLAQTGVTVGGLLVIALVLLAAGVASLRLGRRPAIVTA